jgi:nicotinamide-nucleotide amidase
LVGQLITSVSGSSAYYLGGVIAYANTAKEAVLGVPPAALAKHGAVSETVALAMAQGARRRFGAEWGMSVTGIAGPGGGTKEKPVGLVYVGLAGANGHEEVERHFLPGTRDMVRLRAALTALNLLRRRAGTAPG